MSSNGTVYACGNSGIWKMIPGSSPQQIYINTVSNTTFLFIDASSDGTYIVSCKGASVSSFMSDFLYLSSDNGTSFSTKGSQQNYAGVSISSSGKYVTTCNGGSTIYSSSDYGNTYSTKSTGGLYSIVMSSDAQYTYYVTTYNPVYRSINTFSTPTFINNGSITSGSITNIGTTYSGMIPPAPPTPEPVICFKKGSKILCSDGEYPIEDLKKGMLVKTHLHGEVAIALLGKSDIHHSRKIDKRDQLFVYRKGKNGVTEDLVVTGGHSRLVDTSTVEQLKNVISLCGSICVTDDKFRLPSCIDDQAEPYDLEESDETIYHIALENENPSLNYGIYANGLLMETCQKECLEKHMKVIN